MGVHGLWELLAPVGRRVSVETLAGKRLAVDASIWMVQFMRAMRDDKGDMLRDAHLLGFLRRICKLLFLRARPVVVVDGATPPLKRRTLAARRRHRDAAQAKIRKTAEKLLLSHLKARKLEELAAEITSDRAKHGAECKQAGSSRGEGTGERNENGNGNGESSEKAVPSVNQEKLDELLAASLAAEEETDLTDKGKSHSASVPLEERADIDDDDDDEEMIFPVTTANIDPAVLASLPPSMQLDLLVQMRETVMAENRQKYQKIKKEPAKFSELQIQSYLKTVAFRREIDEVQRCATGKGVGGVQTSKIASEANREFIFSSSFTGDKQMLTQRGGKEQDKDCVTAKKQISSSVFKFNAPNSSKLTQPHDTEPLSDFGPDVETYRDERGRIRVSRVRAMGIRMTRDIQRNLDFIKEHEHVKSRGLTNVGQLSTSNEEPLNFPEHLFESTERWSSLGCNEDYTETINDNHQLLVGASGNIGESSFQGSKETIEVSFLDDETEIKDNDDQMFLHLASGTLSNLLSNTDHLAERKEESDECIWEEGVVEGEILPTEADKKACQSFLPDNSYMEDEVEWEEGVCDVPSSREYNHGKVPKGDLEEETLIQEAIRRSLEDFENQKSDNVKLENLRASNEGRSLGSDADIPKPSGAPGKTYSQSKAAPVKEVVEETGIQVNSDRYDVMHDPGVVTADRQLDQTGAQLMNNDGYTDPNRACSREPVPPSDISVSALAAKLSTRDSSKVQESDEMAYTNTIPEGPKKDDKIIKQDSMNSDMYIGSDKSKCLDTDAYLGGSSRISQKDHMMDELVADTAIQKEKVSQGDVSFSTSERGCGNDDDIRVSAASLEKEISLLRQEQVDLGHERRKLESHAESVSSEMFAECQELLQMFGLPYIIAPTEAEAQCAYMEMKNLVDGVVTDDSDVFLFGAMNVYKNIFDDRKYVETYFMKDVETELGLTREQLIRMALLLGSDYTEGISGIGIVNAIEVVHAFPEEDGLQKFREWIESPDPAILGKLDLETGTNLKKSKPNRNDSDGKEKNQDLDTVEGSDDKESSSDTQHIKEIFMSKHRNVSKNWHIPSTFPSDLVVSAYTSPQVDDSTEPFSWGRPDLSLLRKLCWERFGWSKEKADELLLPVLKEYNKHETQLRLEAFYSFNERFARIRSKRIKKAIKGITGKSFPDADEIEQDNPSNSDTSKKETSSCHARGRGRRNTNTALRNMGHQDPTIHEANSFAGKDKVVQENNSTSKKKCVSSSGRSRGRGRRRTNVGLETMEGQEGSKIENVTLASDEDSNEKEAAEDISSAGMALRRSKRPRKQVIYVEDGHEADDDIDVLMDQIDENDLSQAAVERALAGKDAQSDLVHQEMNKLKSDQVHTDLQTARVLSGNNNEDRHASGFELCEDSRIDSAAKDYLFTGGGFCMEENDEQQDTTGNPSACQPRETMEHGASSAREETSGASDGDQHMDLLNAEESAVNAAVEALEQRNSPSENVSSSRRRNASRGLSAMPTLKRRKGGS